MPVQYVVDEKGQRVAALVPIKEWERIQRQLEDDDITPVEAARADEAWAEYQSGRGKPLEQVMKELIHDRQD